MKFKCPVRKKCRCKFVCTYDRKEGEDFKFTPACFVKSKRTSKETPKKKVEKVLANSPNIWDDV